MKARFAALFLGRAERSGSDGDRNVLIFSTVVTVGLIAVYSTAR